MIRNVLQIEQPYSGEYTEKIYDISSPWNSSEWSWIQFEEENTVWCGEFRGSFRGAVSSEKLGIVVILTADYMYILDIHTAELVDFQSQPDFTDITVTPMGDILVTDGYGVETMSFHQQIKTESIVVPLHPDDLKFKEYHGNILKIICREFLVWDKEIELYLDCNTFEWITRDFV